MPSAKTPDSLTVADVRAAATRIEGHVLRTPVLRRVVGGAELLCKAESLQPTGAFKLRGAFSLMTTLPPDSRGVIAHSSGNHAQAVAWAARALRLPAVIVMPNDAPVLKRARTEALGAEVITVGPDSDERARRAEELACARNLVLVPPYDHLLVAAGQGTAALELVEEAGPLQRFYAPVGGGGLMAGCSTVVAALQQPGRGRTAERATATHVGGRSARAPTGRPHLPHPTQTRDAHRNGDGQGVAGGHGLGTDLAAAGARALGRSLPRRCTARSRKSWKRISRRGARHWNPALGCAAQWWKRRPIDAGQHGCELHLLTDP